MSSPRVSRRMLQRSETRGGDRVHNEAPGRSNLMTERGMRRRKARDSLRLHFRARGRLLAGILAGISAYTILWYLGLASAMQLALSWDFGAGLYLILSAAMMWLSTTEHIERRARELDISLAEIVGLTVVATAFSLIAAAQVLGAAGARGGTDASLHIVAGVATIVLSWFFVHTLFAIHYAHEFYNEDPVHKGKALGGLNFPDEKQPDYWDFVYFAAVVAMTCQVSDVTIDRRDMRHLVTAHGVISFFLNTVIVALAVSIAASLI